MTRGLLLLAAIVLAMPEAIAWPQGTKRERLDQRWRPADWDWFYNTTQGSRLLPYEWFLALEKATSTNLLKDDPFIRSIGFLPGEVSPLNPDRLPIGFAVDVDQPARAYELKSNQIMLSASTEEYQILKGQDAENAVLTNKLFLVDKRPKPQLAALKGLPAAQFTERRWLGLTCAACHTGSILIPPKEQRGGIELIVDGAPAMGDFTGLLEGVVTALQTTLNDSAKFQRFADRVVPMGNGPQHAELKKAVGVVAGNLAGLAGRSRPVSPFGFARLDAFGILMNEIAGTAILEPDNVRRPDAPVSYPFLWNTPDLDWVQWNGFSHSTLARNTGEVLGVFADLKMTDPTKIETSANLPKLFELEERVKMLDSPKWPEMFFGRIDAGLKARGEMIYREQRCAECHSLPPYPMTSPATPFRSVVKIEMTSLTEIGTDPAMAINIVARTGKTGPLKALLDNKDIAPIGQIFGAAVGATLKSELDRLMISPEQRFVMNDRRDPKKSPTIEHLTGYKARPLNGIWATAPYLHNGSVPTLHDLLLPPHKRPVAFRVGSREFDAEKVGYRSDVGDFEFKTELPGNRNTGHYYGTGIGDDDRRALIEFLKSL